jgi:flagellar biosynthesis anti-sigma factor FlgM
VEWKGVFVMVERISGQNSLSPIIEKQKPVKKTCVPAHQAGITDEANISPFAKELGRIMGELERVPEVRQEKVDGFKKKIADGTYNPDLAKVAHCLLIAGLLNGEE